MISSRDQWQAPEINDLAQSESLQASSLIMEKSRQGQWAPVISNYRDSDVGRESEKTVCDSCSKFNNLRILTTSSVAVNASRILWCNMMLH